MGTNLPPNPQYAPAPPPPKKGLPVWLWVLIGLFGLIFVAVVGISIAGYYFVKSVANNPASTVAKVLTMSNPDVEVVSADDSTGKITLRERKTGKTVTIDYRDAKNGKIVFDDDGKTVTLKGGAEGIEVNGPDGTTKIGAGSVKVPAWVPAYPGSTPEGSFSAQNDSEQTGTFTFKTSDAVDKVAKYYEDKLKSEGYKVDNALATESGSHSGGIVSGEDASKNRSVTVTIGSEDGKTNVAVQFAEKKS